MRVQHVFCTIALAALLTGCSKLSVNLPDSPKPLTNYWAKQGWTHAESEWYHHAIQGTNTFGLPVEWFKALEQPRISLFAAPLFSDQEYLARFGFIKSPSSVVGNEIPHHEATADALATSAQISKDFPGALNSENLPVGFAVGDAWFDPTTKSSLPIPGTNRNARSLGLTCAACHSGQLEVNGYRVLINGGASMISLDLFRKALQLSLAFTKFIPGKYERFARNVLGDAYNKDTSAELKIQFGMFLKQAKHQNDLEVEQAKSPAALEEGFARLDALNRIGNEVFAMQMNLPENMHPITAPVSFPYIWNAPWFDWVQYNSSIQQPMVRNLGEAMGVKGKTNLADPGNPFEAYIPIEHLHEIERLLAGSKQPWQAREFSGLQSPKWTDLAQAGVLPKLDEERVAQGRKLYLEGDRAKHDRAGLCVGCHLPPLSSAEIFRPKFWQSPASAQEAVSDRAEGTASEHKFLKLVVLPAIEIGTDCRAAYGMAYRTVSTPRFIKNSGTLLPPLAADQIPADCPQSTPVMPKAASGAGREDARVTTNFGVALGEVVNEVKNHWYTATHKSTEEQAEFDGFRPNGIRALVRNDEYPSKCSTPGSKPYADGDGSNCPNPALPSYRARPLNGVWATAPFLHNGSIPNLYLLLASQAERDRQAAKFYVGARDFDPANVGYQYRVDKGTPGECPAQRIDLQVLASHQGLFELDTTKPGNRNAGHLFAGERATHVAGNIGRGLTCEERFAIIEYLKSL